MQNYLAAIYKIKLFHATNNKFTLKYRLTKFISLHSVWLFQMLAWLACDHETRKNFAWYTHHYLKHDYLQVKY